jgi:hypothetical protein
MTCVLPLVALVPGEDDADPLPQVAGVGTVVPLSGLTSAQPFCVDCANARGAISIDIPSAAAKILLCFMVCSSALDIGSPRIG